MKFRPRMKATPPDGGRVTTRQMTQQERWAPQPLPLHFRSGFDPRFSRKDRG